MRNKYLTDYENMTPLGKWIAERIPHADIDRGLWGNADNRIIRVFGFAPYCRNCIFDYTKFKKYSARPHVSRLRIFGFTLWDDIGA